ncbi:hypothetical protein CC2G_012889 [Coprinopsis cinerea AmutBmut pab1-1]|nr:hypothetical protein CC2G_012889 [Coprinopsis cinerea AmutBmut pab1-1]
MDEIPVDQHSDTRKDSFLSTTCSTTDSTYDGSIWKTCIGRHVDAFVENTIFRKVSLKPSFRCSLLPTST